MSFLNFLFDKKNPKFYISLFLFLLLFYIFNELINFLSKRFYTKEDLKINKFYYFKVLNVGDGDGFTGVNIPFINIKQNLEKYKVKFRLAGIDAPEVNFYNKPKQPFSYESKNYLKKLILNKKIMLKIVGIDIYNRFLCFVFVKNYFFYNFNINIEMVKNGLACVYKNSNAIYDKYYDILIKCEKYAKKKKLNMWSNKNLELPDEYKKKYRNL